MSNLSELLPSGGGQNQVEFVASGTLPNGKPVILKSNGQVEVVGYTAISQTIPAGSEAVFNTASTYFSSIAFDPNTTGKFVVVYRDDGNSEHGTAIVGTVSGTSISFGAESVFNAASTTWTSIAFDPNTTGKFVVVYKDEGNSSLGTAIVGTVSGTSISFGSEVVFNSGVTSYLSLSFDPNTANKFVVVYRDDSNTDDGTAVVGTISGTSISFGSEVVYNTANTQYNDIAFDPNTANKFVVVYKDIGNGAYGTARVGTVSGTSISFGSAVVFNTGTTSYLAVAFNPNTANKFVVAYSDGGNSGYGTAILGTVSGTSVSFGSEVVFNSANSLYISAAFDPNTANKFVVTYKDTNPFGGNAVVGTVSGTSISYGTEAVFNSGSSNYTSIAFDPNTVGKFVVAYLDGGNSSYGTAVTGQIATSITNLTSTNLIGIAAEAASSGATAKINTWGGINEAQSSLTIASDYYVQTDGTITTATGGQKVGQAISATTINMRNQP